MELEKFRLSGGERDELSEIGVTLYIVFISPYAASPFGDGTREMGMITSIVQFMGAPTTRIHLAKDV